MEHLPVEHMELPVAARNAWFDNLSKRERAIVVAKDALAQVDAGRYIADCTYLTVRNQHGFVLDPDFGVTMQQLMSTKTVQCEVCAIGGIFASTVRLGNQSGEVRCVANGHELLKSSMRAFTQRELYAIELVFEGWTLFDNEFDRCELETIFAYHRQHAGQCTTRTMRFNHIMENIIENNGRFVVPGVHLSSVKRNKN